MIKKFRPTRTPIHFARMFQREGISIKKKRSVLNTSELHDASIFLFKHILNPADVRWRLAIKYADLKKTSSFSPINLENGLRANYASRTKGRNKAYGTSFVGQTHVLQLTRALRNIELGNKFFRKTKSIKIDSNYEVKFVRTNSIQKKLDRNNVSGSPEALWQMQLWGKNKYLGRIGINFHSENKKNIVTIANIQGAVGRKAEQKQFEKTIGTNFGNELIKRLQETLGTSFEYRGIAPKEHNPVMYKMVFRKTSPQKVRVWSNQHKQLIEDRRTIKT